MATYEAIGAVGLTLQALLRDRVAHPNGSNDTVPVSLGHPGPERDPAGAAEPIRINLFLYQVVENGYLRNQEIPGHGHPGSYGFPPLSLNLHYLLTVFGSTANGDFFDETPAHRLLGSAMQVLHDHSIITDQLVTRRVPAGMPVLEAALRGEQERIKLTLRPLGLEDLSNVWTSLELSYRLSVAYEVSVVQVESGRPRRYPRPVQEPPGAGPRVYAATIRRPRLTSIAVRRPGDPSDSERPVPFARIGDTLIIRGSNLGGGGLKVRLGTIELEPDVVSPAGHRLEVVIPDDTLPSGALIPDGDRLQPGTHPVEVAATVTGLPQVAIGSARAAFVLVPDVSSVTLSGRVLTITGSRLTAESLPAQVVVGDAVVEDHDYLPGSNPTSVQVTLPTTLPTFPAAALVSGDLTTFPDVSGEFELSITIGSEGPHTATLAGTPGSLPEAATMLQAAIRNAADHLRFSAARVTATERELIIVAGDLTSMVAVGAGALADALLLTAAGTPREVYLSGVLRPFPIISSATPELDLTIEDTSHKISLPGKPTSLAAAAAALESGIQGADSAVAFADSRVAELADRLCILPGTPGQVVFAGVAGGDLTTVAELQLAAAYLVRARVNGVESINEIMVTLPT